MIYTHITPDEFSDWVNLCAGGFEMPPDEFHDHFINDPDADCRGVFVAIDDTAADGADPSCTTCTAERGSMTGARGRMVSSVRVFTRYMYLKGEVVKCGAIGEVCTLREYRGRGLSGKLLNMAIDYMKENGFVISQLFTGVNDHYVRHGWFTVPLSYVHAEIKAAKCEDITVRDAEARDVRALSALHEKYARCYDGVFMRKKGSEKYWIDWMVRNDGRRMVACDKNGNITAYADFVTDGKAMSFREYLGEDSFAPALFSHLAAEFTTSDTVVLHSINAPAARKLGFGKVVGHREWRGCMYRLNTPFTVSGTYIDTPEKLKALLCDSTVFEADNY